MLRANFSVSASISLVLLSIYIFKINYSYIESSKSQRVPMENPRSSKGMKLKSPGDAISPINMLNLACRRRYSSIFDPYASDSSDSPSPLMKYLRSADSAAIVDSPVFLTPVKVEEDVIVMDGIPVPKSNKGGGEVRTRLPLTSSSVVGSISGGRSNPTSGGRSNPTSLGGGGTGNGSDNRKYYKNRLCRFWETVGTCQFGSECQFAHGKEELLPTRSSCKIQLEIFKLNNSLEELSLSSYGTKHPAINPPKAKAAVAVEVDSLLPSVSIGMILMTPVKAKPPSGIPNTNPPITDWTPMDDGIEVSWPCGEKNPSKKDVDAYIERVLYGTNTRKRLPAFVEICQN